MTDEQKAAEHKKQLKENILLIALEMGNCPVPEIAIQVTALDFAICRAHDNRGTGCLKLETGDKDILTSEITKLRLKHGLAKVPQVIDVLKTVLLRKGLEPDVFVYLPSEERR